MEVPYLTDIRLEKGRSAVLCCKACGIRKESKKKKTTPRKTTTPKKTTPKKEKKTMPKTKGKEKPNEEDNNESVEEGENYPVIRVRLMEHKEDDILVAVGRCLFPQLSERS